jgi:serine/threonine protein phosphatase PrpC
LRNVIGDQIGIGIEADDQIAVLLKSADAPEKVGKKLVETANRNGGKDNIAVIVINSKSGEV